MTGLSVTLNSSTTDGNLYDVTTELSDGETVSAGQFVAPKGPQGSEGPQGLPGSTGESGIIDQIDIDFSGDIDITLEANKFYNFTSDNITSLNITLGTPENGKINEFQFQFLATANGPGLTLPEGVSWLNDINPFWQNNRFYPGYNYQISIMNNKAIVGIFK